MKKSLKRLSILIIFSFFQFIHPMQHQEAQLHPDKTKSLPQLKLKDSLSEAEQKRLAFIECKKKVEEYNKNHPNATASLAMALNSDGWPKTIVSTTLYLRHPKHEEYDQCYTPINQYDPTTKATKSKV